jgi:hypothetical protein
MAERRRKLVDLVDHGGYCQNVKRAPLIASSRRIRSLEIGPITPKKLSASLATRWTSASVHFQPRLP